MSVMGLFKCKHPAKSLCVESIPKSQLASDGMHDIFTLKLRCMKCSEIIEMKYAVLTDKFWSGYSEDVRRRFKF